jgi:membrane fusion protein (multidrug efflux system)
MKTLLTLFFLAASTLGVHAQSNFDGGVSAILEPAQKVEIRTSVSGRVMTLPLGEGQEIAQGEILASIDARVQKARVAFARVAADGIGALLRVDAALAQAQALRDRVKSARAKGAALAWEVVQTEHAIELARADQLIARENSAQAKAQLELEIATLEEFSIKAPFPGTVLQIFAELGETVDTQSVILEIGHLDRLSATAFVPAAWANDFSQGQTISVTLNTLPEKDREMEVLVVDPRIDSASQTVRVVLELENQDRDILAGTSVTVRRP